jgi:hypothetical protein
MYYCIPRMHTPTCCSGACVARKVTASAVATAVASTLERCRPLVSYTMHVQPPHDCTCRALPPC